MAKLVFSKISEYILCKKRFHCLVMLCFKSGWRSPTFARIPCWDIQKQNQYASFHGFTRMLKNESNSRNGDLKSSFWLSKWWRWKHHSLKSIKYNYLSSQILFKNFIHGHFCLKKLQKFPSLRWSILFQFSI